MCVAIPGRIVSVEESDGPSRPARVAYGDSGLRQVDLAMVPEATVGDFVIVHSGYAISVLSEKAAGESLKLFGSGPAAEARSTEFDS